jgi:hypothetical protein
MQNGARMDQYSVPHSSCIVSRKLLLLDITSLLANEYLRDQLRNLNFHEFAAARACFFCRICRCGLVGADH